MLAKRVLADLDPVADQLVAEILGADPVYTRGRTPPADLRASCHDNLARILQGLTGEPGEGDVYDAPHETGRRRAEQGLPLESVLHAYRLGHRIIWDSLVAQAREDPDEAAVPGLVEAASHVWELVDTYSSEVTRAYRDTEQGLMRRDDRRRDALIDALLDGRGRERSVAADAASALDLSEHGPYVVVALQGTAHPAAEALAVRGLRSVWRDRADREIGLVALARATPLDVVRALEHLPDMRGGISPVVEGLAAVDGAHRLAETALRSFPRGEQGLALLDSRLPAALVVTAPDLAARLIDQALGGVLRLEPGERDVLLDTLAVWLDTGGSAGQTAARLFCHRNTVLNRIRRIETLTERSTEHVTDLVEWSLALLARRLREDAPPS